MQPGGLVVGEAMKLLLILISLLLLSCAQRQPRILRCISPREVSYAWYTGDYSGEKKGLSYSDAAGLVRPTMYTSDTICLISKRFKRRGE